MCYFHLLSDKVAYIFCILSHTAHMCFGNYRFVFQNIRKFELSTIQVKETELTLERRKMLLILGPSRDKMIIVCFLLCNTFGT